jgi:hypothetical protein
MTTTETIKRKLQHAGFNDIQVMRRSMHNSLHIFATDHPDDIEFYGDMMSDGAWQFNLRVADSMEILVSNKSKTEDSAILAAELVIQSI